MKRFVFSAVRSSRNLFASTRSTAARRRANRHSAIIRTEALEPRTLLTATPVIDITAPDVNYDGQPHAAVVTVEDGAENPVSTAPGVTFSTFFGGLLADRGYGVTADADGNIYVTGDTRSEDLPVTEGAFQTTKSQFRDAFVAKFDPTGNLIWATYLGGAGSETVWSIAVDDEQSVYIVGRTTEGYPTTEGAFQETPNGTQSDGFIAKLNSTGTDLIYATYFGGTGDEDLEALAVDSEGNAYVTGMTESTDLPTTEGALQTELKGSRDAFLVKFNATGTDILFSTYFGGEADEDGTGVAVGSDGSVYLAGYSGSTDLPTTEGAYLEETAGPDDAFIARFDASGNSLIYMTYVGGSGSEIMLQFAIAVDAAGNAYVAGETTGDAFPITPNALNQDVTDDGFLFKLSADGSTLLYASTIDEGVAQGVTVDSDGYVYVVGEKFGGNPYLLKFDLSEPTLLFSHVMEGVTSTQPLSVAAGPNGHAYMFGITSAATFPTENAYQEEYGGGTQDAFLVDFSTQPLTVLYYAGATASGTPLDGPPVEAGTYTVVATFAGNFDFSPASAQKTFTIIGNQATTTALTSSAPLSVISQNVTLTATVSETGSANHPAGSVVFRDGATVLDTVALVNGVATFTTTSLGFGSHSITAEYLGGGNHTGSTSNTVSQNVQVVAFEPDPNSPGQTALFVGGTSGNDRIDVVPSGSQVVRVTIQGSTSFNNTFNVSSAARIYVFGGTGNDNIFIGNVGRPVQIDAGAGDDSISFTAAALAGSMANGGSGNDTLVAPNVANTWNVTGANAGTVGNVAFQELENLKGGTSTDAFFLASGGSLAGTIDGNTGNDRLDYSTRSSAVAVDLQSKTASSIGGFNAIESFVGSSSTGDTLTGLNATGTWTINGANSGTFGSTPFSAFENLVGGTLNDTFSFQGTGSVTGVVNGGAGNNTIDYRTLSTAVVVNLTNGTATRTGGVTNIQNVVGGTASDTITGNSQDNILHGGAGNDNINGGPGGNDVLVGSAGNDVLTAGPGRTILIGGVGIDTLTGGANQDLLIGGSTAHDNNGAALVALIAEWKRTDQTYAQRISHLRGTTSGGANGNTRLTTSTVTNDNAADQLFGNGDLDWFWGTAAEVQDLVAGETRS